MSSIPTLSVVIPTFKEGHRLPRTLDEIRPWLENQKNSYEILIMDGGSPDSTVQFCKELSKTWPQLKIYEESSRKGKGHSVRRGCLLAKGDYVLVMDADHPTPIETLADMIPFLQNYDMVVGVRTFCGEEGASGWGRRVIGLAQQLLAHLIVFRVSVADSQCGFKLFSRRAIENIFQRARIDSGMYDVELFCIAHLQKLRIFSLPVKWTNKEGSVINIWRCVFQDPMSLFHIRLNAILGRYQ